MELSFPLLPSFDYHTILAVIDIFPRKFWYPQIYPSLLTHDYVQKEFGDIMLYRFLSTLYIYLQVFGVAAAKPRQDFRKNQIDWLSTFCPKNNITQNSRIFKRSGFSWQHWDAHVRILSDASFNFDSFWKHVKRGLNPCCFLLVLVIECTCYVLHYIYLRIFFYVSRD